jgi:hypothetical protein
MKAHHKRIRLLRRLALAGCLAGLAVPAGASAMLPNDVSSNSSEQPWTLPARFHSESQSVAQQSAAQQSAALPTRVRTEIARNVQPSPGHLTVHAAYTPPAGFRTEVQTPAGGTAPQTFALRKGFRPEVQTQPSPVSSAPTPSVIRQIETVSNDSGRTLAIVLASIALAVALCSLGYATVRLAQIQRRSLGSGSQ